MKFEYWKSSIDRQWYWHLVDAQNEKLAQGEPHATKAACLGAIELVRKSAAAPVNSLSPEER
ncbi:MAG TPA: YegP family protein [Opitutus sp.]|nr:YegP family protein [Opitutus sp.]